MEHARQLEAQARERALFAEQMMGIVSHDLRNPLSVILLNAELLSKSQLTPVQANTLERTVKAANRASRLVAGLLDFTQARLGRGLAVSPASIDLHATVCAAVQELAQMYPGRELRHVQHGAGDCVADADRLAQMVGNLVSNAMTYGSPTGPVIVTSTMEEAFFSIAVQNQGAPIPEHLMDGLFELMVRGSEDANASRSVGLGLFIVSEIAKAHDGAVSLVSTREDGTIFTVVFRKSFENSTLFSCTQDTDVIALGGKSADGLYGLCLAVSGLEGRQKNLPALEVPGISPQAGRSVICSRR